MEWMLATWSSGNPRALVNEPLRRYSAVILSNCLQSVDSQLTVLQNFSFRQMVYIILDQTCQMHPTKQEVHPTFRPVHPTCRIVSKWPTFSSSKQALIARIPALRRGFLAGRACFSLPNRTHCVGLRFGFLVGCIFSARHTKEQGKTCVDDYI